jgi:uncharacterized RDD family membrane protein YckC
VTGYTSAPPPGAGGPRPTLSAPRVLAGWWSRAGAQLIDGVIVGIGAAILVVAISAPFSIGFFANDTIGILSILLGLLIAVICVSIVALLYAPALMARTNGQTLGRKVTGIRVVRANGKPIDFGFALLREVVVKSFLFGVLGMITLGLAPIVDVLWPLWDEENRALHDFVVDTRSIRV